MRYTLIFTFLCSGFVCADSLSDGLVDGDVVSGGIVSTEKNVATDYVVKENTDATDSTDVMEERDLIATRVDSEKRNLTNPFSITPHKPNYFLPFHYQSDIDAPGVLPEGEDIDKAEFVFQFSVKAPIAMGLFDNKVSLWGAYTQKAAWQSYNSDNSAPFRETNHEPEVFLTMDLNSVSNRLAPKYVAVGFNHQSNGRNGDESRSWNRIFLELFYQSHNTVFSIKPWYRLPENDQNDDNPNIEKYYGYGELNAVHLIDDYSIDIMVRNNLRADNRGAVQLGFSFPLWGKSQGYIQYFNGYGQSLIEYDEHTKSIGLGVILTNWL